MTHSQITALIFLLILLFVLPVSLVTLVNAAESTGYIITTTLPGSDLIKKDTAVKNTITLAQYIQELYLIALGIVGLTAMASIVYHSFLYTISAGNASKIQDAVDGIKEAIFGLILLLSTVLILGLISPGLVSFSTFDYVDEIPNAPAAGPSEANNFVGPKAPPNPGGKKVGFPCRGNAECESDKCVFDPSGNLTSDQVCDLWLP